MENCDERMGGRKRITNERGRENDEEQMRCLVLYEGARIFYLSVLQLVGYYTGDPFFSSFFLSCSFPNDYSFED